jgi:DNA modification methylase
MKFNRILRRDSRFFLRKLEEGIVDLVYLDPPYFSNRKYERKIDVTNNIYSFDDRWKGGLEQYLAFMNDILIECHRVLKSSGSLYLHCDWHASHYLKVNLDKFFGYKNFRNEIIWRRHNAHNDTKQGSKFFGRIHDVILFYTKSSDYIWNPIFQPYPEEYAKKYYRHIESETGRRYALGDLSGPGGRSKGNPYCEFLGIKKYWRYNKEKLEDLYSQSKISLRKAGRVPTMKRYLDEMPGIVLQDLWDDIQSTQLTNRGNTTYPTQKPIRLLERIIEISTNPGNLVIDPFCGSGTTLVAAKNLDRSYLGVDNNAEACKLARQRMRINIRRNHANLGVSYKIKRDKPQLNGSLVTI